MSTRFSIIVLLALLITTLPARAKIDALCVEGTHSTYGDGKLFFSARGFKIENAKAKSFIISTPPNWNIAVFNEVNHKYCVQPAQTYKHQIAANMFAVFYDPQKEQLRKTDVHERIAGIPTTVYECSAVSTMTRRAKPISQVRYWVADKLDLPKATIEAYDDCDNLPHLPGLILRAKFNGKGLDTYTAKKTQVPDSFFQTPAGYTQAKSWTEVMFPVDSFKDLLEP